jgi:RNA polymerase sigma factor (TIGR02999 family)
MADEAERSDTTQLLLAARAGDEPAREALFERLYEPLRALAGRQLRRASGGALQTTELVHEAYLKMCDAPRLSARDRAHFLALAARVMRQVLVDHFRAGSAGKRGGGALRVELDEGVIRADDGGGLVLAVDEALGRLTARSERAGRVVELKFFGGLTEPEIAEALEVSVRTVSTEWRKARAWLWLELAPQ